MQKTSYTAGKKLLRENGLTDFAEPVGRFIPAEDKRVEVKK